MAILVRRLKNKTTYVTNSAYYRHEYVECFRVKYCDSDFCNLCKKILLPKNLLQRATCFKEILGNAIYFWNFVVYYNQYGRL